MTLGVNFIFGTVVTLLAAFFGPPANREVAAAFYKRVLPGGPGWGGFAGGAASNLGNLTIQWLLANGALFSGIFSVSCALGGDVPQTVGYATVSTVCLVALYLAWCSPRSAPTVRIVEKPRNGQ